MQACKTDGQNIEAIHYASAALAARPDSTLILFNLGQYLLEAGAHHQAARVFKKVATLAPTYVDALRGLATASSTRSAIGLERSLRIAHSCEFRRDISRRESIWAKYFGASMIWMERSPNSSKPSA